MTNRQYIKTTDLIARFMPGFGGGKSSTARDVVVCGYIDHWLRYGVPKSGIPDDHADHCASWLDWWADNKDTYTFAGGDHRVVDHGRRLIGLVDRAALNESTGSLVLIDWLIGDRHSAAGPGRMAPPFGHLVNCRLTAASLRLHMQAHMYRWKNKLRADSPVELAVVELRRDGWTRHDCLPVADEVREMMGYWREDRSAYIRRLAQSYALPPPTVWNFARRLGEGEDFDGLVLACEDHAVKRGRSD